MLIQAFGWRLFAVRQIFCYACTEFLNRTEIAVGVLCGKLRGNMEKLSL